jgi:hypothetical protein
MDRKVSRRMKTLTRSDLSALSEVVGLLDEMAAKHDANVKGTLYAGGVSLDIDYDSEYCRHFVTLKAEQ